MDIQTTKIELIKHILDVQKQSVLDKIREILLNENSNLEQNLSPMPIEELKERIQKSEDDFKNGKITNSETLILKYKQ